MTKLDKNLFIRADGGTKIGTGHIMRCLSLAESLKKRFGGIFFVSNHIPSNLSDYIEGMGYKVYRIRGYTHIEGRRLQSDTYRKYIENDASQCKAVIELHKNARNWLLVDHYGIDQRWESKIRNHVEKIVVIDDLANRKHDCDILIDQNFYENVANRYKGLVPKNCVQMAGPRYALLRSEFIIARKKLKRKNRLKRILVSFGGSDPTNETSKAVRALKLLDLQYKIDVVVGNSNPNKNSIKRLCSSVPSISFHYQTSNMAEIMANADLAIGGGGSMTWERCCMGLPTIVAILSENQRQLTEEVAKIGCVINLGQADYLRPEDYAHAIKGIDIKTIQNMSRKCLRLVDGNGVIRVASKIFQIGFGRREN